MKTRLIASIIGIGLSIPTIHESVAVGDGLPVQLSDVDACHDAIGNLKLMNARSVLTNLRIGRIIVMRPKVDFENADQIWDDVLAHARSVDVNSLFRDALAKTGVRSDGESPLTMVAAFEYQFGHYKHGGPKDGVLTGETAARVGYRVSLRLIHPGFIKRDAGEFLAVSADLARVRAHGDSSGEDLRDSLSAAIREAMISLRSRTSDPDRAQPAKLYNVGDLSSLIAEAKRFKDVFNENRPCPDFTQLRGNCLAGNRDVAVPSYSVPGTLPLDLRHILLGKGEPVPRPAEIWRRALKRNYINIRDDRGDLLQIVQEVAATTASSGLTRGNLYWLSNDLRIEHPEVLIPVGTQFRLIPAGIFHAHSFEMEQDRSFVAVTNAVRDAAATAVKAFKAPELSQVGKIAFGDGRVTYLNDLAEQKQERLEKMTRGIEVYLERRAPEKLPHGTESNYARWVAEKIDDGLINAASATSEWYKQTDDGVEFQVHRLSAASEGDVNRYNFQRRFGMSAASKVLDSIKLDDPMMHDYFGTTLYRGYAGWIFAPEFKLRLLKPRPTGEGSLARELLNSSGEAIFEDITSSFLTLSPNDRAAVTKARAVLNKYRDTFKQAKILSAAYRSDSPGIVSTRLFWYGAKPANWSEIEAKFPAGMRKLEQLDAAPVLRAFDYLAEANEFQKSARRDAVKAHGDWELSEELLTGFTALTDDPENLAPDEASWLFIHLREILDDDSIVTTVPPWAGKWIDAGCRMNLPHAFLLRAERSMAFDRDLVQLVDPEIALPALQIAFDARIPDASIYVARLTAQGDLPGGMARAREILKGVKTFGISDVKLQTPSSRSKKASITQQD